MFAPEEMIKTKWTNDHGSAACSRKKEKKKIRVVMERRESDNESIGIREEFDLDSFVREAQLMNRNPGV